MVPLRKGTALLGNNSGMLLVALIVVLMAVTAQGYVKASEAATDYYPFSWVRYSPNQQRVAVGLADRSEAKQIEEFHEWNWYPECTALELKEFRNEIKQASAYSTSGVYSVGPPPRLLWEFPEGQPPSWVSNDGQRLAISGGMVDEFAEGYVARIIGPENYLLDVIEDDVLGRINWALEQLTYGDRPQFTYITQNSKGNLLLDNGTGAVIEMRMSDGKVLSTTVTRTVLSDLLATTSARVFLVIATLLLVAAVVILLHHSRARKAGDNKKSL